MSKKILLHSCCAPCTSGSYDTLKTSSYNVILYFCNSNIDTKEEYEKRLENLINLGNIWGLKVINEEYNHEEWLEFISGYEDEPEKGKRCQKCFYFNLKKTNNKSKELGTNEFTTTLTVSPHKNTDQIIKEGLKFSGFVPFNFKKNDGFLKSINYSKEFSLYRQNYCGCEFSKE